MWSQNQNEVKHPEKRLTDLSNEIDKLLDDEQLIIRAVNHQVAVSKRTGGTYVLQDANSSIRDQIFRDKDSIVNAVERALDAKQNTAVTYTVFNSSAEYKPRRN